MPGKSWLKYLLLASEVVLIISLVAVNIRLEPINEKDNIVQNIVEKEEVEFIVNNQPIIETPSRGFGDIITSETTNPVVLAASSEAPPQTIEIVNVPSKSSYSIAAYGDSMVDTMGGNLEYVKKAMEEKYPGVGFSFYNYGIGAENLESGLARFDQNYSYHNRNYPPVTQISPDIIIVGSYGYNPFSPHDRNMHWLKLSEMVDRAKDVSGNVYVLAEVAPLATGFGEGPGGVNWPKDLSANQAKIIIEQLENAKGVANEKGVGFIDVYSKSVISGSKYGQKQYIATHDGIHTSEAGQILTAEVIASTIKLP